MEKVSGDRPGDNCNLQFSHTAKTKTSAHRSSFRLCHPFYLRLPLESPSAHPTKSILPSLAQLPSQQPADTSTSSYAHLEGLFLTAVIRATGGMHTTYALTLWNR